MPIPETSCRSKPKKKQQNNVARGRHRHVKGPTHTLTHSHTKVMTSLTKPAARYVAERVRERRPFLIFLFYFIFFYFSIPFFPPRPARASGRHLFIRNQLDDQFTEFYRVLPSFTGFYWVLPSFAKKKKKENKGTRPMARPRPANGTRHPNNKNNNNLILVSNV